jgi:hypothetical protein
MHRLHWAFLMWAGSGGQFVHLHHDDSRQAEDDKLIDARKKK